MVGRSGTAFLLLDRGDKLLLHKTAIRSLALPTLKKLTSHGNQYIFPIMEDIQKKCKYHGSTMYRFRPDKKAKLGGWYRCIKCSADAVRRRRLKVKKILVSEAGGQCSLCGYGKCLQALEFHHKDPLSKEFSLSEKGWTLGIDRLRSELLTKCVLLCANCHREVEHGIARLGA